MWLDIHAFPRHRFPRHRNLISINKRFTAVADEDFQLRHDWHTLLLPPAVAANATAREALRFRHFSRRYYPNADELVRYLRTFHRTLGLRVELNTTVLSVRRAGEETGEVAHEGRAGHGQQDFELLLERAGSDGAHRRSARCRVVVVATGLDVGYLPRFVGSHLVTPVSLPAIRAHATPPHHHSRRPASVFVTLRVLHWPVLGNER